ncbi:probable ATP-dependent RNA helicase DDX58 isoform X1 [Pomacea canaliculata]|uniref:probable ATP-dependent RNA helicase DDX58 isoform X1 n=1 Tax=Pomacea canaliculata TaxID=400727 RepID=UPI000D728765|nr:probable ATP-dependent RNA helicase DDX58 isoform X1 [Pomacea canaliculata]
MPSASQYNPKLIELENMISRVFSEEPESRAIIFVKTREMAVCLEQWMKRRPNLKVLKPGKIVGAGASSERGGMTKNQQVDVMQYFRNGDHKIMVATSVAEEGLDIRQCNLVIRYNYVTNEIAMVQARGRARAENSKFVTVASCNQGVAEKDEINIIREMMMHDAIRQLQKEMKTRHTDYHQTMSKIQAEEKEKRDIELAMMNGRTLKEGEVVLRCRKCDEFACMSSDIRTVEKAHHVVIDPEFSDRSLEKAYSSLIKISGDDMFKQGKLHCKKCGLDWGIVARHSSTTFPVIKVESFIVIDDVGRRDAPKKWKFTNFRVEQLSQEELLQYRRRALASGRDA